MKIAMFSTKPYDKESFEEVLKDKIDLTGNQQDENIEITYFEGRLTPDTVSITKGFDAVFFKKNDELTKEIIDKLYENNVKTILLRCAGFNNVDTKACFGKIHVYRVPAYSPYSVAEHAMAMLLTSIRRIHKAYNRTREFNFSISGLTGFDLHGKTIGIIGTGKIGRIFADI